MVTAICNIPCILPPKIGHTERAEGWGCNIYELAPDIALTTGYDPFGNRRLPLALTERYEEKQNRYYEKITTATLQKKN